MAQVTQDPHLLARIDRYLDYLTSEWESVPLLAEEWDQWDEHSQFSFAMDWPIREDRLRELRNWVERDVLTSAQRARYEALVDLVACHRPILAKLLDDNRQ